MDASASDVSGRLSKRTSVASSRVPETDLVPLNFSHTSRGIKNELLLHEAAIKNDVATLKHLIESKVDVNARTHMERVPLHWAAAHGHLDAMAALIQAKCDVEVTDKYGMRPLLMAAWFGHRGAVQLLVESGASCRAVNRQGQTTLHCAAQNNHHEVLAFMLDSTETIKVNAIDKVSTSFLSPVNVAFYFVLRSLVKWDQSHLNLFHKLVQSELGLTKPSLTNFPI